MTTRPDAPLTASGLSVGYGAHTIIEGLDVGLPRGVFTVIVGPNDAWLGRQSVAGGIVKLGPPMSA